MQGSGQSSTVQLTSIGQSKTANDVSVIVTVGGIASDPFKITVKAPYQLGTDPNQVTPVYTTDSTYAWDTYIYYQVEDNFGVAMPVALPVVESFGPVVPDYSGMNWAQRSPSASPRPIPTPRLPTRFKESGHREYQLRSTIPTGRV
jgi:hypothetical protein